MWKQISQIFEKRSKDMVGNIEVIGIDHGWSMVKTATQVFATAVKEIPNEPPMRNDILEYNGKFYSIGERRLEVRSGKTENENFYLLTLAGIAKELRHRGKAEFPTLYTAPASIASAIILVLPRPYITAPSVALTYFFITSLVSE